MMIIKGKKERF